MAKPAVVLALPPPDDGDLLHELGDAEANDDAAPRPAPTPAATPAALRALGITLGAEGRILGDPRARGHLSLVGGLASSGAARSLRRARRFRAVPSPLPLVHFRRALLDEAQAVDSPLARVSLMARQLRCSARW